MKLNKHITDVEFEHAQETKNRIEFINNFAEKQKFFNKFRYGILEIYENNNYYPSYIFNKGRLNITDSSAGNKIIESNNRLFCTDNEIFNDSKILLDRANIVYNWLNSGKNKDNIMIKMS
jgi:excinuclease UvrABC nuclease subunit